MTSPVLAFQNTWQQSPGAAWPRSHTGGEVSGWVAWFSSRDKDWGFSMAAGVVSIVISLPPEPGTAGYISWGKRSEPERWGSCWSSSHPVGGTRTGGKIQRPPGYRRACAFRFPDALGFRLIIPDPSRSCSLNDTWLSETFLPLCKGSKEAKVLLYFTEFWAPSTERGAIMLSSTMKEKKADKLWLWVTS